MKHHMNTHQYGMTRKETLLVFLLIMAPLLFFYVTELKDVMQEKAQHTNMERDVVNNGLRVFISQNKKSFTDAVPQDQIKYIACDSNSPKKCTVNLEILKNQKIFADTWSGSLMDYPTVKLQGEVIVDISDKDKDPVLTSSVILLSEPSYVSSAMKTLHSRILATLK